MRSELTIGAGAELVWQVAAEHTIHLGYPLPSLVGSRLADDVADPGVSAVVFSPPFTILFSVPSENGQRKKIMLFRIVREISVRYLFPRSGPKGALQKRYRTLISRSLLNRLNAMRRKAHDLIPGGCHTYAAKGGDQYPKLSPGFVVRGEAGHVWDVDDRQIIERHGRSEHIQVLGRPCCLVFTTLDADLLLNR